MIETPPEKVEIVTEEVITPKRPRRSVFASGMIRRDRRALAAALAVAMLYGAAVWGVLPIQRAVSWETHLAAAIIGVVLAIALRRRDPVPVVRYEWEGRDDVIDLDPTGEEPRAARMPGAGPTLH